MPCNKLHPLFRVGDRVHYGKPTEIYEIIFLYTDGATWYGVLENAKFPTARQQVRASDMRICGGPHICRTQQPCCVHHCCCDTGSKPQPLFHVGQLVRTCFKGSNITNHYGIVIEIISSDISGRPCWRCRVKMCDNDTGSNVKKGIRYHAETLFQAVNDCGLPYECHFCICKCRG